MKQVIFIFLITMVSLSCSKDSDFGEAYPVEPQIALQSVSTTKLKQFQDSVVVLLEYKDGDGDLGFIHPDSNALQVQDARLNAPDFYFVKPLAPIDEELSIRGVLRFKLRGTFLLGSGNSEKTTFTIKIKDRKGNWSNEVVTPQIEIVE